MGKPLNLPADLIKDWARRQAAASAKLEGREVPAGYVRPQRVLEYLEYVKRTKGVAPDPSLGLEPVRNANGEIVTWV